MINFIFLKLNKINEIETDILYMEIEKNCICHSEEMFSFLGKRWVIPIINIIGNSRKISFNGISRMLEKISPSLLSQNLHTLETYEIIRRLQDTTTEGRIVYELTDEGKLLRKIIISMEEWIIKGNIKAEPKACVDGLMVSNL